MLSHQFRHDHWPLRYLLHHSVINPEIRDNSAGPDCAIRNHMSFQNGVLYQGLDMTANLAGWLIWIQQRRITVSADLEKVPIQVKVLASDIVGCISYGG